MSLDRAAVHQVVPQITDEEIDQMTALLDTHEEPERSMFTAMLGLDGSPVTIHQKGAAA